MTSEGYSPADYAAMSGNNGFGGGNEWFWIVILFLFRGGWGNGSGNGGGNCVTQGDLQRGFDQSATISKLDTIGTTINNGFANAELSRVNGTMSLSQQLNNMSMANMECCCENKAQIADLKYTIATEACADRAAVEKGVRDIIDNNNSGIRAILDKMCQAEIDGLKQRNADQLAEINALKFAQSQTQQNAYIASALNAQTSILSPTPIPAYIVQNPNCCGQVSTCGCGCNG